MSVSGRHSVIIHAHFYQPPREDPWLDLVPHQAGAAPFHDWNERIERECYRAVVAARVPAPDGRIGRVINTLDWISFNAGPTLLEWLERHASETYQQFLSADRRSRARTGYGNALALPCHHTILPLASRRDKLTEVRWGIADFRRRFQRDPDGMWLPETALDDETLDVLAECGVGFTIVAPSQVPDAPPRGLPGVYTTQNGRRITLLIYDGALSHQVAFGPLIRSGEAWIEALKVRHPGGDDPALTTVATDGETYGHHHTYGEMALAAVIERAAGSGLRLEAPAAFLARHPATTPVSLVAPSSWSCSHGVGRWQRNCGCRLEPERYPSQAWRGPLRDAFNWLAAELHDRFEREGAILLGDVWEARDAMAGLPASPYLLPEARRLLEMERNALRMFTSCGWFFDDIAGIETRQCLSYALRAIELTGEDSAGLTRELGARLQEAISNDPAVGTGADLLQRVSPPVPAAAMIAAGHAAATLFPWGVAEPDAGAWQVESSDDDTIRVTDTRTGQSWIAGGSVRRDASGRLAIHVRLGAQAEEWPIHLPDLPEPARVAVRASLTEALFTPEVMAGLYALGVPLREATTRRLAELLPEALDLPSIDPALLHGLLDLLDLEGEPVPFDAQTRFWHLLAQGKPAVRDALRPFTARFGFSTGAAPATSHD